MCFLWRDDRVADHWAKLRYKLLPDRLSQHAVVVVIECSLVASLASIHRQREGGLE